MNKHTTVDSEAYHFRAWLLASDDGSLNMTRAQPSAGLGQVAIALNVTVPRSLYRRPLLRAVITLPEVPPMDPNEAVAALTEAVERGCDFAVSITIEANTGMAA